MSWVDFVCLFTWVDFVLGRFCTGRFCAGRFCVWVAFVPGRLWAVIVLSPLPNKIDHCAGVLRQLAIYFAYVITFYIIKVYADAPVLRAVDR